MDWLDLLAVQGTLKSPCPQSYFKAFLLQFLLLASFLHAFLRVCKILTARCLGNQDWRYIIHLWSLALAQGLVSVICSILFGKIRKEGRNFLHYPTTIYGMEHTHTHMLYLVGKFLTSSILSSQILRCVTYTTGNNR